MKRMKKVLAMLLAFAMVMGMSLTTFAADSLDIPVSGADGATFKNAQLIQLDSTKETGWEFVNTDVAEAYIDALEADDAQDAIWKLINKVKGADENAASDGQIAAALRTIKEANPAIVTLVDGKTVTEPGVYFIDAEEEDYVYNAMAAYVSFEEYEDGVPTGLVSAGTVAKKASESIVKSDDQNAVTEIGKEVTYTIETKVPYIAYDNDANYVVTDTISGADYKLTEGKMMVSVKVGTADAVQREATLNDEGDSFTLNLNEYAKDANRQYAGKDLVITYVAVVTDLVVENNVVANDGDHESIENTNIINTGNATILKKDSADQKVLKGAEFVLQKGAEYATFVTLDDKLVLSGWVDDIDEATHIVTGDEGTATVYGLDSSDVYVFVEVIAPTGYSLTEIPASITWDDTGLVGSAEMLNTKLSALPSTGGIGTAVFTIGGCAIMVAAAYFFLASRKKES